MKNYREVKIGPYSAYAIAKKNGFEGTEEEWLESLKPPAVDPTLSEEGKAADAKVTGDALATKAVIDDTAVGPDAWSSKHIVDVLCPPLEETGNPVVCYPVAGYPLGCKVSWEPTQEGSGDPSPDNVRPIKGRDSVTVERCGKNLWSFENVGFNQYKEISTNYPAGKYVLSCEVETESTSDTVRVGRFVDGNWKYSQERKNKRIIILISASVGISGFRFYSGSSPADRSNATYKNIQLELGNGATTYAPYIGQTATLTLPRTIYGGTVDAVTGEGQETWKLVTLDGTESWNTWGLNANNPAVTGFYTYDINNYAIISAKVICSNLAAPNQDVWGGRNAGIGLATSGSSHYFIYSVPTSLLTDISAGNEVASLKAYLAAQYAAGTPVQIAYKLATPTPFTATGAQPIPALPGVNTLMTDADSVAVTGRADPIKRITDLEDAVASMTNT